MDKEILSDAGQFIVRNWDVVLPDIPDFEQFYKELKHRLALSVGEFLAHDFEGLLNALYRMDIREPDFHAAMQLSDQAEIAHAIAELIIRREMEKAETRRRYREWQEKKHK